MSPAEAAFIDDGLHQAEVGESPVLEERLVLAPCEGRFRKPDDYSTEGQYVMEGQVLGQVLSTDRELKSVRSPFAGWVMGFLLPDGSPVRASEPIAWLRSA